MKKTLIIVTAVIFGIMFAGCAASAPASDVSANDNAVSKAPSSEDDTSDKPEEAPVESGTSTQEQKESPAENETSTQEQEEVPSESEVSTQEQEEVPSENEVSTQDQNEKDTTDNTKTGNGSVADAPVKGQPIVWLGDSLTQGSLGDENDNLAGAPYEKLKTLVDVPVEGHGFYGWNTHDVLWAYTAKEQLGQTADPHKTYIFWLGSNDWVVDGEPNTDTKPVIDEIDRFLHLEGNIPNYIVIGTTSRHRLKDLYLPINADLEEHYKEHYMDVIDIINWYGYSEDKTHLSQECYDAVAESVYEKLKKLGYI